MSAVTWDFTALSMEQELIQREIGRICEEFGDEYWREHEEKNEYPHDFADLLAENGWLGALIPEEYEGSGVGTKEMVVMMEEIAASGAGFGGCQAIHGAIYTSRPIVEHGNERLREELLPKFASGELTVQALGLTEPNAGSESTAITTRAERDGDEYVINGQKVWTSRLDVSDFMLLVARTKPPEEATKKTDGISMFLVDMTDAKAQGAIEMKPISKTALNLSHSFEVWLEDLRVPVENRIGKEHEGFYYLLDGLNDERLVIAAECIGHARLAIDRAAAYANEREVFDRPIGKNQAIQHPLAEAYMRTLAAKELVYETAEMIEELERQQVGILANSSKFLAADAAFTAADAAVQTHGGFGVAREYDVERYFRNARIARIAPISQELALNYVSEKALGLPRSF
ncbi:acyl-CoA dehydrogenase family protein [Natronorarus salvus]|uniref:acyl-CoA dehydrogenase family protein n=1 Tax=Natronorarus salvus TaxID=3117733 RepID=UPI002F264975